MLKSGIYDFVICRGGTDMCFVLGFGRKRLDLKQYRISGLTGRVSGHRLQAAPILKRRRRRKKDGIGKKGSLPKGFRTGGKYRRKGAAKGPLGSLGAP